MRQLINGIIVSGITSFLWLAAPPSLAGAELEGLRDSTPARIYGIMESWKNGILGDVRISSSGLRVASYGTSLENSMHSALCDAVTGLD